MSAEQWSRECAAQGIKISPGKKFDFNGRDLPRVLMGFASLQPEEAREALKTARKALDLALRSCLA